MDAAVKSPLANPLHRSGHGVAVIIALVGVSSRAGDQLCAPGVVQKTVAADDKGGVFPVQSEAFQRSAAAQRSRSDVSQAGGQVHLLQRCTAVKDILSQRFQAVSQLRRFQNRVFREQFVPNAGDAFQYQTFYPLQSVQALPGGGFQRAAAGDGQRLGSAVVAPAQAAVKDDLCLLSTAGAHCGAVSLLLQLVGDHGSVGPEVVLSAPLAGVLRVALGGTGGLRHLSGPLMAAAVFRQTAQIRAPPAVIVVLSRFSQVLAQPLQALVQLLHGGCGIAEPQPRKRGGDVGRGHGGAGLGVGAAGPRADNVHARGAEVDSFSIAGAQSPASQHALIRLLRKGGCKDPVAVDSRHRNGVGAAGRVGG